MRSISGDAVLPSWFVKPVTNAMAATCQLHRVSHPFTFYVPGFGEHKDVEISVPGLQKVPEQSLDCAFELSRFKEPAPKPKKGEPIFAPLTTTADVPMFGLPGMNKSTSPHVPTPRSATVGGKISKFALHLVK